MKKKFLDFGFTIKGQVFFTGFIQDTSVELCTMNDWKFFAGLFGVDLSKFAHI